MKLKGFRLFGGMDPAAAALRKALAWRGVKAPHTGKPFSEEVLLGLGGGIGAGYVVVRHGETACLAIGMRHSWHDHLAFLKAACMRLGVLAMVKESTTPEAARRNLVETLEANKAAICWLDRASLACFGLPEALRRGGSHVTVVFGLDEARNRAWLSDAPRRGVEVAAGELAAARARFAEDRHRLLGPEPPHTLRDFGPAVREAIRACVEGLRAPRSADSGLGALEQWGRAALDLRTREGWAKTFAPGVPLWRALSSGYESIAHAGDGAGLRDAYAGFLDDAAALLGEEALSACAALYRVCAERWRAVAEACLPGAKGPLARMRRLLDERHDAWKEAGHRAAARLAELAGKREKLERAAFPLDAAGRRKVLKGLGERVLELHAAEANALAALAEWARP